MFLPKDKLSLLSFPQQWNAGQLSLRLVCLPRGNPFNPLMGGTTPAVKDADLELDLKIIPSLDRLPDPTDPSIQTVQVSTPHPPDATALFTALAAQFDIDPAIEAAVENPRTRGATIKKLLVPSYTSAFAFSRPRTPYAVLDDSYACALRNPCRLKKTPGPPPTTKVSWGQIIASALRQPMAAEHLGLIYPVSVPLDPLTFADGGWVFATVRPGGPYSSEVTADPDLLKTYAARIPAMDDTPRQLFASVLFPVSTIPVTGNFDEIFAEAAAYDDGFAKIVHCAQACTSDPVGLETESSLPPVTDTGVQIGCDDEQQLIWMNRQLADPATEQRESPMGVAGFRIDVREVSDMTWHSLMRVQTELAINGESIGSFDGELKVNSAPTQLDNEEGGEYWLATYLTEWQGWSLVVADPLGLKVSGATGAALAQAYTPVDHEDVALRYGKSHEFRVRLVDISGGGPTVVGQPVNPASAPTTRCDFRRNVPPRDLKVDGLPAPVDPLNPPSELRISRPRLGYPAAIFAGIANARQELENAVVAISSNGDGDVPGLPDPDVTQVQITIQVAGLDLDDANDREGNPPLRKVYDTIRQFPADPAVQLVIPLTYQDIIDVTSMTAPATGGLTIPTARDVVITLTPLGKPDPDLEYFGSQEARIGRPTEVPVRRAPFDETDLFVDDLPGNRLRGIMLQPDEKQDASLYAKLAASGKAEEAETDMVQRLAEELDLDVRGLTLTARPGVRTLFACAKAIPHTLSPDRSSITFSSKADLVNHWICVLNIVLKRDWTWDALDDVGFDVVRKGTGAVGTIEFPRVISPLVLKNPQHSDKLPDRTTTRLLFFDAVDPKPVAPQKHPTELDMEYELTPRFRHTPDTLDDPLAQSLHLPVAVPPMQTPKLASAGIALSPYQRAADYSSTEPREQALWFEFAEEPDNPSDLYFARVLSYAPDPMLTGGIEVSPPAEPPLPIDPENIRVIRPGQSDDSAGLTAMQRLIPTDSPRHFIVPLPPGLYANTPELFGFFVYEIRVGHYADLSDPSNPDYVWSTAQGRFGPALRVTGVQHSPSVLSCNVQRTTDGILASAKYAMPVFEGRKLMPAPPKTEMWVLLYAQVTQVDGADHRNVLLGHRSARPKYDKRWELHGGDVTGFAGWTQFEIMQTLNVLGLKPDIPLSVLAVECLPEVDRLPDPLGANLGNVRILRSSPLTPVPAICMHPPCPATP